MRMLFLFILHADCFVLTLTGKPITAPPSPLKVNLEYIYISYDTEADPDGAQLVFLYFSTIHFFRMYFYQ